jgi:hypothetical protein
MAQQPQDYYNISIYTFQIAKPSELSGADVHTLATALANCPTSSPFHFHIQAFPDSPMASPRSLTQSPQPSHSLSLPQDETPPPIGHNGEEVQQQSMASKPISATDKDIVITPTFNSDQQPSSPDEPTAQPNSAVVEIAAAQPPLSTTAFRHPPSALIVPTSADVPSLALHDPNTELPCPHTPPLMQVNFDSPRVMSPVNSAPSRAISPAAEAPAPLSESPNDLHTAGTPPLQAIVAPGTDSTPQITSHPTPPPDCLSNCDIHVQLENVQPATDPARNQPMEPNQSLGETTSTEGSSVGLSGKKVRGKKQGCKNGRTRVNIGNSGELTDTDGTRTKPLRRSRNTSTSAKVQGPGPSNTLPEKQASHKRTRPVDEEVILLDGRHGVIRKCK